MRRNSVMLLAAIAFIWASAGVAASMAGLTVASARAVASAFARYRERYVERSARELGTMFLFIEPRALLAINGCALLAGGLGGFALAGPAGAAVLGALGAADAVMLDGGISAQLRLRDPARAVPLEWRGMRKVPLGLIARVRAAAADLATDLGVAPARIALGGRSMGGRICSMAVAEGLPAAGLVLIAYPLHQPGRPDALRVEHLPRIDVPCLFVSGTGDAFGTPAELEAATAKIAGHAKCQLIVDDWAGDGARELPGAIIAGDRPPARYFAGGAATLASWTLLPAAS